MELPPNARVDADSNAVPDKSPYTASRSERALARGERARQERLARLKYSATCDEKWCDALWTPVDRTDDVKCHVAGHDKVAVVVAVDVYDSGPTLIQEGDTSGPRLRGGFR